MSVPPERSSAMLVMISSKFVSISATAVMLDKSTVAKIARFERVPKFDALVRRIP